MQKIVFFFLAFGGFLTPLCAQETWSLERCIEYSMESNLNIQRSALTTQINEAWLLNAKANTLPTINGTATNFYRFGQTIDPFTNEFATSRVRSNNFSLNSSVVVFNGFQTTNSIKQSQLNLQASQYDLDKARNDISLQVAGFYIQVLFNQELLSIAQAQRDITAQQVERTRKLVDAGSLPKGNLYDLEAQLAGEELNVITAQNNLDLSYLALKQVMQLEPNTDMKVEVPNVQLPEQVGVEARPGQVYDMALTQLPDIKGAETRLESSAVNYSIAKGGRSPRLVLSGSYGTGYSGAAQEIESVTATTQVIGVTENGNEQVIAPSASTTLRTKSFGDQIEDNLNRSIGFTLSVPIFNGLNTHTNISRARLNMEVAAKDLELTKNNVRQNIESAYADAVAAAKNYRATLKSVEALEESFKYAQQRFDVGLLNAVDYNLAKNNLLRAQSDLLRAKFDYVYKVKVLDFYQGKALSF